MNTKRTLIIPVVVVLALLILAPAVQGASPPTSLRELQTADTGGAFVRLRDPGPLLWRDDFDGALQPEWTMVNENPGEWSLEVNPGFLTIWTSPAPTGEQNLLLRQAPAGDFSIQTRLLFTPSSNYEIAGLVMWQDPDNFLQFGRAFCDFPENCVGNGIYFDLILDGTLTGANFHTQVENLGEAHLRLIRQGQSIRAYYSGNGFDWMLIGEHTLPAEFKVNAIGLTSAQHYAESDAIPADFDYFALNQAPSPFAGSWQAIDVDGSSMRLAIGGSRGGLYRITWTESYFGFCGGEAGIARGIGWISPDDPFVLEASLLLTCFTTGDSVAMHPVWRYDPATNWLRNRDDDFGGFITTWHRPGESLPLLWDIFIAHPDQEWVEGMGIPEGTVVSLLIRDSDGVTQFVGTATAFRPPWNPDISTARFESLEGYDLKAGDHLLMSDGMVVKEHVVTNLWITGVDLLSKTVSGVAEPFSEVIIEGFPVGEEPVMFSVFADQDGIWTAGVPWLTPGIDGLASQQDEDGDMTRVGFGVPRLDLRVNYGHDWVESFFPAGHEISIQVTDQDGNEKATAEVFTTPRDEWGGDEGFQTIPENWAGGVPPDIQPNDWVYAQVDSGQTAEMQIGDINGMIDLANDAITGTIDAPWFPSDVEVFVECHPWGAGGPQPEKYDAVLPDSVDTYTCSWFGEWDIQAGQDVGVGYFGPDGHWVANAFFEPVTILVNSTADALADDGFCTLREAVIAANTNTPSGAAAGECPAGLEWATDTILLADGALYSLTIDSTDEADSADGDLDLLDNSAPTDLVMRVEGGGAATISQDAAVDDRVMQVMATVEIEGLTLTSGTAGSGGGVFNIGTLSMQASEVSGNHAGWVGGGLFNWLDATLTVDSSMIYGNSSDVHAGGLWNRGTMTVTNSTLAGNVALDSGGGIQNSGLLAVENSVFSANSAGQGGALYNEQPGSAMIQMSNVIDGSAWDGGGGLFNLGTMTVEGSAVSGNWGPYGGGLFNWIDGMLTISNSTISGNSANQGGGLTTHENSTTVIQNSSIIGNTANWAGGGVNNWGSLTITDSVLRENTSSIGVGNAINSDVNLENAMSITGSCIVSNGGMAVFNSQPVWQIATGNWWGDASGPSGIGPGSGDAVSDNIDYFGWLVAPPAICAVP